MFWGPHYFYSYGNHSVWGFPSFFTILFFIGIVILFFSLFRKSSSDEKTDEDTALEILKKRYAKGELTKRQFMEMKKDIG
jgi:putative membrane protein